MQIYITLRNSILVIEPDVSPLEIECELSVPMIECELSVKKFIRFQKEDLPIGMGAFTIGSELYLTGGEILCAGARLTNGFNSSKLLNSSCGDGGLNSIVYLYQPDSDVPFNKDIIKPMNEPKTNPRVVKVDRRVYILSSYPYCMRDDDYKYPVPFECYDPVTKLWEVLPEPPNYSTDPISHRIRCFFVFNSRIYMSNRYGLHCYDVGARTWNVSDGTLDKLGGEELEWVSVAEGIGGLAVVYVSGKGLVGYLFDDDRQTICKRQSLKSVNKNLQPHENCKDGFVYHLGDNKFSYVLSTEGLEANGWRVRVYDFKVEVKGNYRKGLYFDTSVTSSRWFKCDELISFVVFMVNGSTKVSEERDLFGGVTGIDTARRRQALLGAADKVLVATAKGKKRWSHAIILTNRLKLKFMKNRRQKVAVTSRSKKPRATILCLKSRNLPSVQRKTRVLGRLVPGCRKKPLPVVLDEATDYIAALEMQVRAMSALTEMLSGSNSSFDSTQTGFPND